MKSVNNPNTELVKAQRTCFIACLCMYLVVGLNVLIGVVYLYASVQTNSLDFLTASQSLRSFADILLGILFHARRISEALQQRQSFWKRTIRKAICVWSSPRFENNS